MKTPISKVKHPNRKKNTISVKGIGRLLLVPVLGALKPRAARWLSDWVRRKSAGAVAFVAAAVGGGAAAAEQYAAAIVAGVVALALFLLELAASWALKRAEEDDVDAIFEGSDEAEGNRTDGPHSTYDEGVIPRAIPVTPASAPELTGRERGGGFALLDVLAAVAAWGIAVAFVFAGCSCSSTTGQRVGDFSRETLERVSGVVSFKYQGGEMCICVGAKDLFGGGEGRLEADRGSAALVPTVDGTK